MSEEKKITLESEEGEKTELYVLEETRIGGTNYLLVTDSDQEEDGQCYILKDKSKAEEDEALYEFVEEADEIDYLYRIFSELMADMDIELTR